MTPREEIKERIWAAINKYGQSLDAVTDEVLEIIHKQIDEEYKKYPERNKFTQAADEYFKSLGIDIFYSKVRYIFREEEKENPEEELK